MPHSTPMLSLDNTYSEDELRDWERRVHELSGQSRVDYVCELKLDGMSLALRFESGRLALGITRGDGTVGEDVTLNVRTVRSVPLNISPKTLKKAKLPPAFEVRGELLMPLAAFQRMNEEREQQGLPKFANPRNATAGTVRVLEPNVTAQRRLDFFSYGLLVNGRTIFDRHSEALKALANCRIQGESQSSAGAQHRRGVGLHPRVGRPSATRCLTKLTASSSRSTALRCKQELGFTGKAPRWAIAYKFAARSGVDADRGHPGAGRPHRKADAGRRLKPVSIGGHHRQPRHAA